MALQMAGSKIMNAGNNGSQKNSKIKMKNMTCNVLLLVNNIGEKLIINDKQYLDKN